MDEEIKQLAALALRNAFWADFSALVNKYLEASEGLDVDTQRQEAQMGDLTSVYGRDYLAGGAETLNLWTRNTRGGLDTTGHETMREALEHENAEEVHLQGKLVFKRVGPSLDWYYNGE